MCQIWLQTGKTGFTDIHLQATSRFEVFRQLTFNRRRCGFHIYNIDPLNFGAPQRALFLPVEKIVGDNSARAPAFESCDPDVIQSSLSPQDVTPLAADDRF